MAVTLIAHTEVGSGGAANIEFTSIPGTYDDLWLTLSVRGERSLYVDYVDIRFNGTSTNYSYTELTGISADASTARAGSQAQIRAGISPGNAATASTFSNSSLYIPNYKNTSYNKQIIIDGVAENNSTTENFLSLYACLWSNTASITSIRLAPSVGPNFLQYSQATLYGITKA